MAKKSLKIYVASSWRNTYQPAVVSALRVAGHDVYDFRNPEPGNDGFRWTDIDSNWENWTAAEYEKALEHPVAQHGFNLDLTAVITADLCVLVLPSGRSASWEYGFHCGMSGRAGIVYMPEKCQPELMYSGSKFTDTLPGLLEAVDAFAEKKNWQIGIDAFVEMLDEVKGAVSGDGEEAVVLTQILTAATVEIEKIILRMEKAAALTLVKELEPETGK